MKKTIVIKSLIGILLFFQVTDYFSQDILIKNGDSWHYYDEGYLDESWSKLTDFTNWKTGVSPLGYGDKQNKTELSFGGNTDNKQVT